MLTFSEAGTLMRRARNEYRRIGNNTYLHESGPDAYAVRYHSTDVVTIHRDGTFTLNTGRWDTVTTKMRLNGYSPARIGSERGTWYVQTRDDPRTPPKMGTCRKCHGAGRVREPGRRDYYEYDGDWNYKRIFPPKITMPRWAQCWNCQGTGQKDYGSKRMPVIFYDGIRVDSEGRVIGADGLERLNEPAEVTAARQARLIEEMRKVMRNVKRDWIREHGAATRPGEVILFKAVRDDLRSAHGAHYPIGGTVTAPDYVPNAGCGGGLHFSPSADDARSYDGSATRFLACAVDRKTMVVISGGGAPKAKARSCRVLYEVDEHGARLQAGG